MFSTFTIFWFVFYTKIALSSVSPSIIHGAQLFQSNCAACHSVKYLQGSKDIPTFPTKKTPAVLGVEPPDLSLEVNIRGAHWVYVYLDGFYPDPKRPFGVNNRVYPDTAMPNMLAGLKAQMTPEEFNMALNDMVSFLNFASDPHQAERKELGYWVIAFLMALVLLLWLLFRTIARVRNT